MSEDVLAHLVLPKGYSHWTDDQRDAWAAAQKRRMKAKKQAEARIQKLAAEERFTPKPLTLGFAPKTHGWRIRGFYGPLKNNAHSTISVEYADRRAQEDFLGKNGIRPYHSVEWALRDGREVQPTVIVLKQGMGPAQFLWSCLRAAAWVGGDCELVFTHMVDEPIQVLPRWLIELSESAVNDPEDLLLDIAWVLSTVARITDKGVNPDGDSP